MEKKHVLWFMGVTAVWYIYVIPVLKTQKQSWFTIYKTCQNRNVKIFFTSALLKIWNQSKMGLRKTHDSALFCIPFAQFFINVHEIWNAAPIQLHNKIYMYKTNLIKVHQNSYYFKMSKKTTIVGCFGRFDS